MIFDVNTYSPGNELEAVSDDVWKLLCLVDEFFIPPLSQRRNVASAQLTPSVLSTETLWGGPVSYFESLMQNTVALAHHEGAVIGIVSWSDDDTDELLGESYNPNFRLMTIATHPDYMNQGVGQALIDEALLHAHKSDTNWIVARNWSNGVAIPTLIRHGFEEIHRLPDHRGAGIDSIYFALRNDQLR